MSTDLPIPFANIPESIASISFLRSVYPKHVFEPAQDDAQRPPFVTLTYAQSMDAKIAGKEGKQLILSGKESMELTHRMRELHDSILVGVGTVLNDDPQLNSRIPSLLPVILQPRPIILDRDLLTPPDCKLLRNFQAGIGQAPVIVAWHTLNRSRLLKEVEVSAWRRRSEALIKVGAHLVFAKHDDNGRITLKDLLDFPLLCRFSGRSLMIEGGSSVISSLLPSPEIDLVITTVAPVYVGEGVELFRPGTKVPELEHVRSEIFGKDVVFASKPKRAA
ncbi:2,5-diamino-6-(ribosylamino)-4(3H)-pyrimidinone 5'-phosphate reductase [Sporobolomyces salmoneus]|uniref:2,5-diamino-6-(ribosylamino)-4(3H)-pyrimidinone 5'-phosphate reductase n=1 Tax=Sporobolomyces salmoneus TaxID=183962 RepID=UPI0031713BE9